MTSASVETYEVLAAELRGLGAAIPPYTKNALRYLERLNENLERYLETLKENEDDEELHAQDP